MKLLNQSLKYISVSILIIVSLWSVVFYYNLREEIYDSIDEGLDNYKMLIIQSSKKKKKKSKIKSDTIFF